MCSPYLDGSLIEFGPWGINLGAVWSQAGNWIQVRFLHVVIKVTRGKMERETIKWGRTEGEVWEWVSKAVWMSIKENIEQWQTWKNTEKDESKG